VNPLAAQIPGKYPIWTEHFPKASWYFASSVIHLTGNYSLGKVYHPVLLCAAFFYLYATFLRMGLSARDSFLAALVGACGPVQINQLSCFYVDGAMGSLTTMLIAAAANLLFKARRSDAYVAALAGCLLVCLKFTGIAYLGAIGLVWACLWFWLRRRRGPSPSLPFRTWLAASALFILASVVIGFDPYITNVMERGNPLYPLVGPGKIEIINPSSPDMFNDPAMTRVEKLGISIFSQSENVFGHQAPLLKWPFTIHGGELGSFHAADLRIGAWGVWFSGALCIALLLYGLSQGWRLAWPTTCIIFTLASVMTNPHAWWARYAPQIALLPLLLSLPALFSGKRWLRVAGRMSLLLLLINTTVIACSYVSEVIQQTGVANQQIEAMVRGCGAGDYIQSGATPFNYEQFFAPRGIHVTPRIELAPGPSFAFRDVILHKPGSTPGQLTAANPKPSGAVPATGP